MHAARDHAVTRGAELGSWSDPRTSPADSTACFSYWYSHLFRGASAFVHPTARGIEPLYSLEATACVVRQAAEVPVRLLEILAMLASIQIGIASLATPWLVDASRLQELRPFVSTGE